MQTTRGLLVIFTKWEVPLRIEKSQWGSCLKKKKKERKRKKHKQEVKNYLPIPLLHVSSKIYDSIFKFFTVNSLISQSQSGFKPGDSCTNQLLSIIHQIYKSFDDGREVRSAFLDMSKAFDKVWYKGLIFKLKQNGISGNLLSTLTDFLKLRKQRVVLNGQLSSWSNIESGVPQMIFQKASQQMSGSLQTMFHFFQQSIITICQQLIWIVT